MSLHPPRLRSCRSRSLYYQGKEHTVDSSHRIYSICPYQYQGPLQRVHNHLQVFSLSADSREYLIGILRSIGTKLPRNTPQQAYFPVKLSRNLSQDLELSGTM